MYPRQLTLSLPALPLTTMNKSDFDQKVDALRNVRMCLQLCFIVFCVIFSNDCSESNEFSRFLVQTPFGMAVQTRLQELSSTSSTWECSFFTHVFNWTPKQIVTLEYVWYLQQLLQAKMVCPRTWKGTSWVLLWDYQRRGWWYSRPGESYPMW